MRVLMTGGSGFIGRNFIRQFPNYAYTVVTRRISRAAKTLPDGVNLIDSLDSLENLDAFDAVINLCGEPIADKRWTPAQKRIICDSRWLPTQQLVRLFESSSTPPEVLVSGSAIGFYGDTGNRKTAEDDPPLSQDFPYTVCDRWEELAREAETVTRVVILRTGVVLGADGGALSRMLTPYRFGLGGRIGSGQQYMSWIHIADMVTAMDLLLRTESARGAFNMTAPNALRNDQFSNSLARAMGTRARMPVPEFVLRSLMGESVELILGSQRIYPQRLLDLGYEFKYPQLDAALENILQ